MCTEITRFQTKPGIEILKQTHHLSLRGCGTCKVCMLNLCSVGVPTTDAVRYAAPLRALLTLQSHFVGFFKFLHPRWNGLGSVPSIQQLHITKIVISSIKSHWSLDTTVIGGESGDSISL